MCHKKAFLEFARCYYNFDWNQVLGTDETKIKIFVKKHSRWFAIKLFKEKNHVSTLKYSGGSVVLWSCFVSFGPSIHGI